MQLIEQSHEILTLDENALELIELAARTCYKSEDKITPTSSQSMAKMLINKGHHAMIEMGHMMVKFITNRSVTHELVRHRLCSFAQESTRYVKYDGNTQFISPCWIQYPISPVGTDYMLSEQVDYGERAAINVFVDNLFNAEVDYKRLIHNGWKPEQAREVLPNALKTEIVVKANFREWRHIFDLRCSKHAHPQIRALMKPLLIEASNRVPIIFNDLKEKYIKDK